MPQGIRPGESFTWYALSRPATSPGIFVTNSGRASASVELDVVDGKQRVRPGVTIDTLTWDGLRPLEELTVGYSPDWFEGLGLLDGDDDEEGVANGAVANGDRACLEALRDLGALALWPANSLFVEGYLTTRGDAEEATYRMIRDAGFEVDGNPLYDGTQASDVGAGGFRLRGVEGEILKPDVRRPT